MPDDYLELCRESCSVNIRILRSFGERIGFGHLIRLVAAIWGEEAGRMGVPGSNLTVGPCESDLVDCRCVSMPRENEDDHCDWCCGVGRVTRRVARAQTEGR